MIYLAIVQNIVKLYNELDIRTLNIRA